MSATFKTPIGWFHVEFDERCLYKAQFVMKPDGIKGNSSLLYQQIKKALHSYFENGKYLFKLPLKPLGTPFQQRLWEALLTIPAGMTITYGELAKKLNSSARAVGQACKKNPLPLFIPCHRVVGKSNLGGYMGQAEALHYKINLLNHEVNKL